MNGKVIKIDDKYITIDTKNNIFRCKKSSNFIAIEDDMPIKHIDLFHKNVRFVIKSRHYAYTKDGVHKNGIAHVILEATVVKSNNKFKNISNGNVYGTNCNLSS